MRIEDYLAQLSKIVEKRLDDARVIRGDKVDINQVTNEFGSIRMGLVLSNRLRKLTPIKHSTIKTATIKYNEAKQAADKLAEDMENAKAKRMKERELAKLIDSLTKFVDIKGPELSQFLNHPDCEEMSWGLIDDGYVLPKPGFFEFKKRKTHWHNVEFLKLYQEYLHRMYMAWKGVDEVEDYSFFYVNSKFGNHLKTVQDFLAAYQSNDTGNIIGCAEKVENVVLGLKNMVNSSITERPMNDKRLQYREAVREARAELDAMESDRYWYYWLLEPIRDGFVSKDIMELANYLNFEHRKELLAMLLIQDLGLEDRYCDDYDKVLTYVDNKVNSNYDQLCKLAQKDL